MTDNLNPPTFTEPIYSVLPDEQMAIIKFLDTNCGMISAMRLTRERVGFDMARMLESYRDGETP